MDNIVNVIYNILYQNLSWLKYQGTLSVYLCGKCVIIKATNICFKKSKKYLYCLYTKNFGKFSDLMNCYTQKIYDKLPNPDGPSVLVPNNAPINILNKQKGMGYAAFFQGDDSDISANIHTNCWGSAGRNDVNVFKNLGCDIVRLYDWNPAKSHPQFMDYCNSNNIKVAIPVSNYFLGFYGTPYSANTFYTTEIPKLLDPTTKNYIPSVGIILIGNEPELTGSANWAATIVQAMTDLLQVEQANGVQGSLPQISVPVSFGIQGSEGPAIAYLKAIQTAMQSASDPVQQLLTGRYIPSFNTTNTGADISNLFYSDFKAFSVNPKFLITEYSPTPTSPGPFSTVSSIQTRATGPAPNTNLLEQLTWYFNAADEASQNCQGVFIFQYLDQPQKQPPESLFGFTQYTKAQLPTNSCTPPPGTCLDCSYTTCPKQALLDVIYQQYTGNAGSFPSASNFDLTKCN